MTYLITQILLCLLIAFLLGLILGYFLCKICACCRVKKCETEVGPLPVSCDSSHEDEVESATINLDTSVDLDAEGYDIETLEGVGPQTGDLFRGYGVATIGDYLRQLHTPISREQAAKDLNILTKPLHDWASMSDLLRVEGINHQYAELLYTAGIVTVSQLANSNAVELVEEMESVNNAAKQLIAPTVPSINEVNDWIARSRGMSPVVSV